MNTSKCLTELQDFLSKPIEDLKVTVMPDFFLDRIANLSFNVDEFSHSIKEVTKRKGGSIDGIHQVDVKGGNAINAASALVNLGASVTPIICTSEYGLQLVKYHFRDFPMDYSHVKIKGRASITTALEFQSQNEKINVMLRDLGALEDFNPCDLDETDFELIEKANYVCLFNWAGTRKHGTALAQDVFKRAKQDGKNKTYYDTADPNPNAQNMPQFIETILKSSLIDILSLNENEAITYAKMLDESFKEKSSQLSFAEYALEAARVLSQHFSARIDLHTAYFSASIKGSQEVVVPSYKIEVFRATGAGDSWNAGNIIADYNGLSDECRLTLANAVSACYLSGIEGKHPTRAQVLEFLKVNS